MDLLYTSLREETELIKVPYPTLWRHNQDRVPKRRFRNKVILVYPLAQFELDMVGLTNGTRQSEPWLSNFTIHPKSQ